MTSFIVFNNAGGTTTAIPLKKISKTERKLILASGGQIKKENELTGTEEFPRGGKPKSSKESK
jgi:hypothetical protein